MESMKNSEVVNDIVHGLITLPPYIKAIIDTNQFQRLRDVSQLGMVKFVYPCATHSRFEHSIGTFHLASELLKKLRSDPDSDVLKVISNELVKVDKVVNVDNVDKLFECIEIAALCHDLGHGPFSHLWDHAIFPYMATCEAVKSHELMSVEIIEDILSHNVDERLIRFNNPNSINLIGAIILGNSEETRNKLCDCRKQAVQQQFQKYENLPFIFEIVANKKSGLDVDKFDYLCRDPIYLGWSNRERIRDMRRMIHFFKIAKYDKDGKWHLALRSKEIFNVHEIFYSRHKLHRYGCQHKTVRAVEGMVKKAVARVFKGNEDNKMLLFENVTGNAGTFPVPFTSKEFISKACDYHVWDMIKRYDPGKVVEKINKRNLYKLLYRFQVKGCFLPEKKKDEKSMEQHAREIDTILNEGEDGTTFYVDICEFKLRSEPRGDPLEMIPFFHDRSPNACFMFGDDGRQGSLPNLVQLVNDEHVLTVFMQGSSENIISEEYLESIKKILLKIECNTQELWGNRLKEYVNNDMAGCEFREIHY